VKARAHRKLASRSQPAGTPRWFSRRVNPDEGGIVNRHTTQPRRILVVANETAESTPLRDLVRATARDGRATQVLVVAPALNGRLRHWVSDSDEAEREARGRLRRCVDRLAGPSVEVNGMVGDADPLQATADALRLFAADQLVIATRPEPRSNRLERRLVERARERFALPTLHVVADAEPAPRAAA
jgi:hypothetical protein